MIDKTGSKSGLRQLCGSCTQLGSCIEPITAKNTAYATALTDHPRSCESAVHVLHPAIANKLWPPSGLCLGCMMRDDARVLTKNFPTALVGQGRVLRALAGCLP